MEEFIDEVVAPAGGALGTAMVGMVMMMPDLSFQQSGQVSGNSPQPGTPGGGGAPTDSSIASLATALALVPAGAVPVAVFPPFAR